MQTFSHYLTCCVCLFFCQGQDLDGYEDGVDDIQRASVDVHIPEVGKTETKMIHPFFISLYQCHLKKCTNIIDKLWQGDGGPQRASLLRGDTNNFTCIAYHVYTNYTTG